MDFLKKITSFFSSGSQTADKANNQTETTDAATGVVRNFNHSRGFGFIHSNAFSQKIFLHISELESRVKVGQSVTFEVEKTDKGLRAKNVQLAAN